MTDALSQREIDRLLADPAAPPEVPAAEVVPFRFARPPRLTAVRQRRLEGVAADFARSLGDLLTGRFRVLIEATPRGVEVVHARDAVAALGEPFAAFRFEARRGRGADALLDLGATMALDLVERVFGGSGGSRPDRRALTALEQAALAPLIERALGRLAEAWQGRMPIDPTVAAFHAESELLVPALGDADQLVTSIELRIAGRPGFETVAIPYAEGGRALGDDDGRAMVRPGTTWLGSHLREAQVALAARLPVVWLDARRIAGLAVGDVLELGHPAAVECELEVNGHVRFRARPGQTAGRLALRITEVGAVRRADGPPRPELGRRS